MMFCSFLHTLRYFHVKLISAQCSPGISVSKHLLCQAAYVPVYPDEDQIIFTNQYDNSVAGNLPGTGYQ